MLSFGEISLKALMKRAISVPWRDAIAPTATTETEDRADAVTIGIIDAIFHGTSLGMEVQRIKGVLDIVLKDFSFLVFCVDFLKSSLIHILPFCGSVGVERDNIRSGHQG
jgi:hypothetical protein